MTQRRTISANAFDAWIARTNMHQIWRETFGRLADALERQRLAAEGYVACTYPDCDNIVPLGPVIGRGDNRWLLVDPAPYCSDAHRNALVAPILRRWVAEGRYR